ncbi:MULTISPECIES: acyltransferase [unclassified Mesorhizobium]|uniref:acyltransferase family protein n=1 Tax=unclassified Mesorhizobium TaxID=325217 RepID=UPI001129D5CF|nr:MULTISPECIES: acyltransferase [unclassified Mesorhizobium]TPI51412.1 acyltransferase [Mesorhizobium sp. B3-1-1]TPJ70329.1 acyltransferase [Mesorhizobium sp. B2-6-7]TPJ83960.1 acyltransferase [Mesorhizobium sp. B2-6-3]TPJ96896.1 acyltransferase [Mesorhizobium sp. B2-5-10]TPK14940.1 acyltransferase [Mesorhizobium sp. B2-5-11]
MADRNASLDGLRGIAAVSVVFYHSILHHEVLVGTTLIQPIQGMTTLRDVLTKIMLSIFNGNNAVLLFFVLSGFVLSLSLEKSTGAPFAIVSKFVVRRVCRLYPALFGCLAAYYLLSQFFAQMGWAGVPSPNLWLATLNALLVQITWHGPSTTIQAEMLAVPFVLAFFFFQKRFGSVSALVLFSLSVFAMAQPVFVMGAPHMSAWISSFAIGMLIADRRFQPFFSGVSSLALWLIIAAFVIVRMFVPFNPDASTLGQVILCAALVGSVYYGDQSLTATTILANPVCRFLGKISYSFYLINVLFLLIVWSLVDPLGIYPTHALETGLLVGTVVVTLTLPFAYFSEKWLEQGGITLGRLLTTARTVPQTIPAPAE